MTSASSMSHPAAPAISSWVGIVPAGSPPITHITPFSIDVGLVQERHIGNCAVEDAAVNTSMEVVPAKCSASRSCVVPAGVVSYQPELC